MLNLCESCRTMKNTRSAFVQGIYYRHICGRCIGDETDSINSTAAGHARRRDYEDHAQDTIQPYNANGEANPEFLRLYPYAASKTFNSETIDKLKRKI